MLEIALLGMDFWAYHGFYPSEQKNGNRFTIDVKVQYTPIKRINEDISSTINYEELYIIVKKHMEVSKKLLETIVENISEDIFNVFSEVQSVNISLSKHNPPIGGLCEQARITYSKSR